MPSKIELPNREDFEKDCGVMRWHQLIGKYRVSKNTIKAWKREYGLSDIGVKGVRRIVWDVMPSGCWNCTSHKASKNGYPQGSARLGRSSIARVMYERSGKTIPEGHVIRHKCDNPLCINPDHLETGEMWENIMDRDIRGRTAKGEGAGQAKLTNEQVSAIRGLKGKMSTRATGKAFGISGSNVWHIWNNRTWKK